MPGPFENVDFSKVQKQIIEEFGKVFPDKPGEKILPEDSRRRIPKTYQQVDSDEPEFE